jgi:hypothetical protein
VKIYLVCDETKRALSIGHTDWVKEGQAVNWTESPCQTAQMHSIIDQCAPRMPLAKTAYTDEIKLFCADNPMRFFTEENLPEDYKKVSSYWETAYVEQPKAKRRKVQAVV